MKIASAIAGVLLGALFLFASIAFFFNLMGEQKPPTEPAVIAFMTAFAPTGYLTFVKVCELIGGILVAIPKTRNFGLLVLGPIIVNILAFHVFVAKDNVFDPMIIAIVVLAAFLLVSGRKAFAGLLR